MWGYITGWVWFLLSLTMIGVLALAVLSIPAPPGRLLTPSGGQLSPSPKAPGIPATEPAAKNTVMARSSVTTPEPRREAGQE